MVRTLTNSEGLSKGLVEALRYDSYTKGDADFSATELILPSRIVALRRLHGDKIVEDASDMIYRMLGRVGHALVENSKHALAGENKERRRDALRSTLESFNAGGFPLEELSDRLRDSIDRADKEQVEAEHGIVFEHRYYATVTVNGKEYRISGQVDDYDRTSGIITDYKLTSRWSVTDDGKDEWHKQQNIYAWLLEQNEEDPKGARIEAIFRDWSKLAAFRDPSYPQAQVGTVEIPLWPSAERASYVYSRVESHVAAIEEAHVEAIPICTPDERWEKPAKYAVKKPGRKTAIRVLDSEDEAKGWMAKNKKPGESLFIEKRPGESTRCKHYCDVREFCEYGRLFAR